MAAAGVNTTSNKTKRKLPITSNRNKSNKTVKKNEKENASKKQATVNPKQAPANHKQAAADKKQASGGKKRPNSKKKSTIKDMSDVELFSKPLENYNSNKIDLEVSDAVFERTSGGDAGLKCLLSACENRCLHHRCLKLVVEAPKATKMVGTSDIAREFNLKGDYSMPVLRSNKEVVRDCEKGGEGWMNLANTLLDTMHIFLTAVDDKGLAPIRWNWTYNLCKELGMLKSTNMSERLFAGAICLNQSCATPDSVCIQSTKNLQDRDLLDPRKMAAASVEEMREAIRAAGTFNNRAQQLKDFAIEVVEKYGGIVPCDHNELMKMKGFGHKTVLLILSELFGGFDGIAPDKHVTQGVLAYNLVLLDMKREFNAEDAEMALLSWVEARKTQRVNRVFGSMAQLFTQQLMTVTNTEDGELANSIMDAMLRQIRDPVQTRLLWFAIAKLRSHYKKIKQSIKPLRQTF